MRGPHEAREERKDFTVADQRAYVLVIETETGRTVRTEEVKGLILGQVLTNDTLAVETSQSYYPGGNGHGTITTFSLDKPATKAATIPTDKWLVGATQDTLLLAPSNMSEGHYSAQPLTRLSESGDVVGTVAGVTDVYRGGWVGRVKDGNTPTTTDNTDDTPLATPTELVHLDAAGSHVGHKGVQPPGLRRRRDVPARHKHVSAARGGAGARGGARARAAPAFSCPLAGVKSCAAKS